ncbi:hypothetical protein [Archangium lansingense]|uniref:Uncharacterized protein n=1 Tax=Archangium lansingense TaxID=2995310 RepID=A0ABT4A3A5_9BACT|nr:hypothetical protein [Archangium lansinium]MCY1076124.1 hypothetical protein [Archangium lansinium]
MSQRRPGAEARVCAAPVAGSGIVWRGDFETGDRTQWDSTQMVSSDRLQVVPQREDVAALFPGMLNYLKVGLYRSDTVTQTGVVYHDGWTMARSLADVL